MGQPSGDAVVVGLSFDFHDAACAIVVNGRVVAAAEQERFSRRKHDAGLPIDATRACLEVAGIQPDDVTDVVFYEKPLLVATRYLAARRREGIRSFGPFVRDAPAVLGSNLMVGYRVARMLRRLGCRRPPPLRYVEHHLSHAASAFFPSPFDEAATLTVDGIGEWATASIGVGSRNRLSLVEEIRYPSSLGLLYSFVTAYCGFTPNDDEYKVMGLAPYGRPRFRDALDRLAELHSDGSFEVDARALRWYAPRALDRPELAELFDGPPRRRDDPLTMREADLAASVQDLTESAMLALARRAREVTGSPHLCLAGGVALNCVANGKIAESGIFDDVWIQPAAGDSGGAVGAALAYTHLHLGVSRAEPGGDDGMAGAALGPEVSRADVEATLAAGEVAYRVIDDEGELTATVAARLAAGDVVGWFDGRMEFGPRALGHRSILADPRHPELRQRLNQLVKGREDFRPFAPAVLAERATEWYGLTQASPYMGLVAPLLEQHHRPVEGAPSTIEERAAAVGSVLPVSTHVDHSARVQTVDAATHPRFHRLISEFDRLTGCPVVANTSFNVAGEPIVCTVDEALATARAGGLDLLVVGDVLVEVA